MIQNRKNVVLGLNLASNTAVANCNNCSHFTRFCIRRSYDTSVMLTIYLTRKYSNARR